MPVLLLLLAAMAVEITVLVLVGSALGVLPTFLLLLAASVLGMALLRREGARTRAAFAEAMRERRLPHREMTDGVFIAVAGALILLPGFVSDVLALGLLFPPTRALVRRVVLRRAGRAGMARAGTWGPGRMVVDADFEVHERDSGRPDGHSPRPTILLPGKD